MERSWLVPAIAALGCLLAPPVAALQILPVHDGRSLSWILQDGTPEQVTPGPGFPVFDALLNIVGGPSTSQHTSITATQMGGTAAVFVNTDEATSARSEFDITFRVDEKVGYALSGVTYGHDTEIALSGPSGVLFEAPPQQGGYFPFSVAGTLLPGVDYRLLLALAVPDLSGEWEFAFTISPVPEASNLLALGIAWIACATRRRRLPRLHARATPGRP